MALPFALFAMIASMALAGAAVMATVDVQHGAQRDNSAKGAIAAADAGANVARLRLARYATVLATQPCLKLSATNTLEGTVAESDGWCPDVSGTVGGGSYVYRVSPAGSTCGAYKLCVISTGIVGGVSRRIEVTFNESAVQQAAETEPSIEEGGGEEGGGGSQENGLSGFEGLIGQAGIELSGNADVRVGVGTNGDVTAEGNASVCGDIRHGVGKGWHTTGNASQCNGYEVTEGNTVMPPVSSFMPADIATNNSDYRLVECTTTKPVKEPSGCESDAYSGHRNSTKPWNASARAVAVASNDTLTLSGGDYWICSLSLSGNSQLIMAAGAQVRLFFDTPENCGLSPGTAQIALSGNTRIASSNKLAMPAFYLLGSETVPTSVNLTGNASTTDEFVIYGPNTTMNISGNATYKGVIAGKKVVMSGNGKIEDDSSYEPPAEIKPTIEPSQPKEGEPPGGGSSTTVTTARYFTPQTYVECSGTASAGSQPDADC